RIVNRTRHNAEKLAADIGGPVQVYDWDRREQACADVNLVVNSSVLGMEGKAALDLSLDLLPVAALVNDIVYTPLQTALLRAAAARGNRTVDGLGMLLHQARPGFAAWFGVEPEVDATLRARLLADIGAAG
ncbi:MAG TPA: shikimate dehydrogenase, partial [Alphaproteobacteria bacterium]|nr:shikimate dehydrogenase [Alphaproteobacteria bacterium]